jgi:dTDP-4-dehydrorhamnose reductase
MKRVNEKVLVLGASGYVGRNMVRALEHDGVDVQGWSTADADLSKEIPFEIGEFETVINCAGLADMDRAEDDPEYRARMFRVNAVLPWEVRLAFNGYLVHVSSPFALFQPEFSSYGDSKRLADEGLRGVPNTLKVYPGWLHGGVGSKQLDAVARQNLHEHLIMDNVKRADPTHVDYFCACVSWLIRRRVTGDVLVYQYSSLTAEQFVKHILRIWGDGWEVGTYEDRAARPSDWSYSNKHLPQFSRCRLEKGRFHVEAHVQQL